MMRESKLIFKGRNLRKSFDQTQRKYRTFLVFDDNIQILHRQEFES